MYAPAEVIPQPTGELLGQPTRSTQGLNSGPGPGPQVTVTGAPEESVPDLPQQNGMLGQHIEFWSQQTPDWPAPQPVVPGGQPALLAASARPTRRLGKTQAASPTPISRSARRRGIGAARDRARSSKRLSFNTFQPPAKSVRKRDPKPIRSRVKKLRRSTQARTARLGRRPKGCPLEMLIWSGVIPASSSPPGRSARYSRSTACRCT